MKTVIISNFHIKKLLWIILRKIWLLALCAIIAAGGTFYFTQSMRSVSYYHSVGIFVSSSTADRIKLFENGEAVINNHDFRASFLMVNSVVAALQTDAAMSMLASYSDGVYTGEYIGSNISFSTTRYSNAVTAYVFGRTPQESYEVASLVAENLPKVADAIIGRGQVMIYDYPVYGRRIASTSSNKKYVILGGAVGGLIPLVIILIKGIRSPIIRWEDELSFCSEEEVIASLGKKKKRKRKKKENRILQTELFSENMPEELRDEYAFIRSVLFTEMESTGKNLLFFIGAEQETKKTQIALNIAASMAESGRNVFFAATDPDDRNIKDIARPNLVTAYEHNAEDTDGILSEQFREFLRNIKETTDYDVKICVLPVGKNTIRAVLNEGDEGIYIGIAKRKRSSMLSQKALMQQFAGKRELFGGYIFDRLSVRNPKKQKAR